MPEIRDTLLEDALATLNTKKIQKKTDKKLAVRIKKHYERSAIKLETMELIFILNMMGWDMFKIAKRTNVSEQTIKKWKDGHSCPHQNNLIALRNLVKENGNGS